MWNKIGLEEDESKRFSLFSFNCLCMTQSILGNCISVFLKFVSYFMSSFLHRLQLIPPSHSCTVVIIPFLHRRHHHHQCFLCRRSKKSSCIQREVCIPAVSSLQSTRGAESPDWSPDWSSDWSSDSFPKHLSRGKVLHSLDPSPYVELSPW